MTLTPRDLIRRWWTAPKTLSPALAWFNLALGLGCLALAAVDLRLGLGTYGRWFLGYVGVLSVVWAVLAFRFGADPGKARWIRVAGDGLFWAALILFALLGLFAADERETGPLWTLAVFVVIAGVGVVRGRRPQSSDNEPRSSST